MILSIMLFFVSIPGLWAQGMPVYDNTNFITLGKSLIEAGKQTSQLMKTVNFLKEQKEKIEQVSSVIKQLTLVEEIIANNQQLYDMVRNDLREILSSPYIHAEEVNSISDSFNVLLETAMSDVDFMRALLKSNYLNMTDAERLQLLESQQLRSRNLLHEITLKKRRYQEIILFRQAREAINHREAQY